MYNVIHKTLVNNYLFFVCISEFEWMLGQTGAVKTLFKDNPRPKTRDVLFDNLHTNMWNSYIIYSLLLRVYLF